MSLPITTAGATMPYVYLKPTKVPNFFAWALILVVLALVALGAKNVISRSNSPQKVPYSIQ